MTLISGTKATRTRIRNMNLGQPEQKPVEQAAPISKITKEMKDLAIEYFVENRVSNAAKTKADKARGKLYKMLKEAGIKDFDMSATIDGTKLELETIVSAPEGQAVDCSALKKLVNENQFMSMIEASQKSVTDIAGGAVLQRVLIPATGKENVKVTVKRA